MQSLLPKIVRRSFFYFFPHISMDSIDRRKEIPWFVSRPSSEEIRVNVGCFAMREVAQDIIANPDPEKPKVTQALAERGYQLVTHPLALIGGLICGGKVSFHKGSPDHWISVTPITSDNQSPVVLQFELHIVVPENVAHTLIDEIQAKGWRCKCRKRIQYYQQNSVQHMKEITYITYSEPVVIEEIVARVDNLLPVIARICDSSIPKA